MSFVLCYAHVKVVRVGFDDPTYLLINGKSRTFPDNYTVTFFGFDINSVEIISKEMLDLFEPAEPLDSTIRKDNTPDEVMRTYVAKFRALQDNDFLIKDSVYIYWTSNPAIALWKGIYFSTSRCKLKNKSSFYSSGYTNILTML